MGPPQTGAQIEVGYQKFAISDRPTSQYLWNGMDEAIRT